MERNRIGLIVDDNSIVARSLSRLLSHLFDDLFVVNSEEEAEAVLRERRVTHLVCDVDLGPQAKTGVELVADWRDRFRGMQRAILLSGYDMEKAERLAGVDAVLRKPSTRMEILSALDIRD